MSRSRARCTIDRVDDGCGEVRMSIKVIVQFRAKPGKRAELRELLRSISAEHGPTATGFLRSTVYEAFDSTDGLVEIAEWDSADAQTDAVRRATDLGVYAPVIELVAAPFAVTRIR
jgi:quinol monooxygenase YgiN